MSGQVIKRIARIAADYPITVVWVIAAAWAAHAGTSWVLRSQNIWSKLATATSATSVYLGLTTFASLLAGAIGTVTTLGLSSRTRIFRNLRDGGGKALRSAWPAMLASALVAATAALSAATLSAMGYEWVSPWLFELGVLGVIHASWRLVWLLTKMIEVVQLEDESQLRSESEVSTADIFPLKRPG